MTPRPLAVLAGSDARIFDLVAQVAAIVERHGIGTPADVVRIAAAHLRHPHLHEREAAAQKRRAEAAEAEAQRLREKATQHRARIAELETHIHNLETRPKVWAPAGVTHRRVAYLTQLQVDILAQACRGRTATDIAADMGMKRSAVQSHIGRCADAMEADSPLHAVSLVNRNVVEIRVKSRRAA